MLTVFTWMWPMMSPEKKKKEEEKKVISKTSQSTQTPQIQNNYQRNIVKKASIVNKNPIVKQEQENNSFIIPWVNDGNFSEKNNLIIPWVNDGIFKQPWNSETFSQEQLNFMSENKDEIKQNFGNMSEEDKLKIRQISQNTINQNQTSTLNKEENLQNNQNFENQTQNNTQNQENSQKQENNISQIPQNQAIDYGNWDVAGWKSRWSKKDELENAIEKKYGTVASWKDDGSLEAVINGEKFSWKIDWQGNPVKTSLWQANQGDINKNNFLGMLQNWSSVNDLNDYIYKNNLQDDPVIKKQMEQKYLDDFQKPILEKYKNYSLEDLYKAVENGELIPWTDLFNKLPQAGAYMQAKDSFAIINAKKEKDYTAYNTALDIEKISENHMSKVFDVSWAEKLMEKYRNDPDMKRNYDDIALRQKNIVNLQKQYAEIWDIVRRQMQGSNEAMIQAEITRQAGSILTQIKAEEGMMNASASLIDLKRTDLQLEFSALQYTDNQKRAKYTESLNLYKYERWRLDDFQKMELQFKNQELAFNRQHQAQKEIMELQQKYKGWTYQVWVDGSLNYIVNWQAQKVKFDDWQVLFTNSRQDVTTQTKLNEDWTFSVYSVSKDWKNVNIQNYDLEWNLIAWMPNRIADALAKVWVDWKQCWEWVNDYLNALWVKGKYIQDSWESKKALINSEKPIIWWLAIWNPASVGSKNHKYWHVGIVEWMTPDWQYVLISDWNADWVSEKFTRNRKVPISEITKTWWFNKPPIAITKENQTQDTRTNFQSFWLPEEEIDLSTSEWVKKYPNEASFKNNNPTWLTYNAVWPKLREEWKKMWIRFEEGGKRPASEWWNYVKFASIQDWMEAYKYTLKRSNLTVFERLKQWRWWWNEGDVTYANNILASAWLNHLRDKRIDSLSNEDFEALIVAQLPHESGWLFKYMKQNGWISNNSINIWNTKTSKNSTNTVNSWNSVNQNLSNSYDNGWEFSRQALSWAEDLWKWLVTMKEIPSKSRDEVQEAKKYLEKQWFFKLKEDDEQAINIKSKIDLINSMLEKNWDLNSLSWRWQMDYWFDSWKKDMINNIESLLSNDVLKALIDAKANWATFGALSNAELDMLRAAADRLWTWAIRNEKTQRITWFDKSEDQLKEDLRNFKDKYIRAYKKATGIDIWNPAWL